MKKMITAGAIACVFTAGTAMAGNVEDAVVEAPVIVEEATASSASGMSVVALMALLLLVTAAD